MRFLLALSLFVTYSHSYGQRTSSELEKIKASIIVEINGCSVAQSISKRQLTDQGFSLKVEGNDYRASLKT